MIHFVHQHHKLLTTPQQHACTGSAFPLTTPSENRSLVCFAFALECVCVVESLFIFLLYLQCLHALVEDGPSNTPITPSMIAAPEMYVSLYIWVSSISLSLSLSLSPSLPLSLSLCVCVCVIICASLSLSLSRYLLLPLATSLFLSLSLSLSLYIYIYICLSLSLSVSLCLSVSIYLAISLSRYLSVSVASPLSLTICVYCYCFVSQYDEWMDHVGSCCWCTRRAPDDMEGLVWTWDKVFCGETCWEAWADQRHENMLERAEFEAAQEAQEAKERVVSWSPCPSSRPPSPSALSPILSPITLSPLSRSPSRSPPSRPSPLALPRSSSGSSPARPSPSAPAPLSLSSLSCSRPPSPSSSPF